MNGKQINDCVFKSVTSKIERDTSELELISSKELHRSIQFFRFSEHDYKLIIEALIRAGYLERIDKQNYKLKRRKNLLNQTA